MEAIPRRTIQEVVDRLRSKYPIDKFILLGSWPGGDTEMPRDVDLVVNTVPIPLEGITGDPPQNGYIYEISKGRFAPMKPLLMQIADAGGIDWKSSQPVKDVADNLSEARTWAVAGLIRELSGDRFIMATKRIDFAFERDRDEAKWKMKPDTWRIWIGSKETTLGALTDSEYDSFIERKVSEADLQRRGTSNEMGETKAKERLVREAFALPQTYTKEQLQGKQFAVLRVIFAPRPESEAEKARLMEITAARFFPAFGLTVGASPQPARLIEGQERAPRQIEGTREQIAVLIEDNDDDPEPAQQEPSPGAEATAESVEPPKPQDEPPLAPGSEKITHEKIDFLQAIRPLKDELLNLLGALKGSEEYYKLMLATTGCQHANQIPAGEKQGTFYRKLERMVKLIKENPKTQEPVKPFQEALDMARPGYAKLSLEKLNERMEAQIEIQKYPIDLDPLGINPIICTGDKAKLIDAILAVLEWGMTQTMKSREQAAADPRGGAR